MRQDLVMRVVMTSCLGLALATGCESLQRKFTRKSKAPQERFSPIINFQDYTRTMTPLDRYRKHYLMFDYWNGELLQALQSGPPNPKRYRRASTESLGELETMKSLVTDDVAGTFDPLLKERAKLDQALQVEDLGTGQASSTVRLLEFQTREIHRDLFWRTVQDQLKPQQPAAQEGAAPQPSTGDAAAP